MAELTFDALKKAHMEAPKAKITVLGYAFLEERDDTRNTPAVPLIDHLKAGVCGIS